jgi:hypothetical protein
MGFIRFHSLSVPRVLHPSWFWSISRRRCSWAGACIVIVRRSSLARSPNGWPMCRRSGCIGLPGGEAWAVGTIGLLDAPDALGWVRLPC